MLWGYSKTCSISNKAWWVPDCLPYDRNSWSDEILLQGTSGLWTDYSPVRTNQQLHKLHYLRGFTNSTDWQFTIGKGHMKTYASSPQNMITGDSTPLFTFFADPFHIYMSYQATSKGVSCLKFLAKFQNLNFWHSFLICNFDFVLFWLGDLMWITSMGNHGVGGWVGGGVGEYLRTQTF